MFYKLFLLKNVVFNSIKFFVIVCETCKQFLSKTYFSVKMQKIILKV